MPKTYLIISKRLATPHTQAGTSGGLAPQGRFAAVVYDAGTNLESALFGLNGLLEGYRRHGFRLMRGESTTWWAFRPARRAGEEDVNLEIWLEERTERAVN